MEAGDNEGALKILTALRASSKLSEYEQQKCTKLPWLCLLQYGRFSKSNESLRRYVQNTKH